MTPTPDHLAEARALVESTTRTYTIRLGPSAIEERIAAAFAARDADLEAVRRERDEALQSLALLHASLTVPERYVGVVSDAVAEEIERLRARVRDLEAEKAEAALAHLRATGCCPMPRADGDEVTRE